MNEENLVSRCMQSMYPLCLQLSPENEQIIFPKNLFWPYYSVWPQTESEEWWKVNWLWLTLGKFKNIFFNASQTWNPPANARDQKNVSMQSFFLRNSRFLLETETEAVFGDEMQLLVKPFFEHLFLCAQQEINETNWAQTATEQHSTQREMAKTYWEESMILVFVTLQTPATYHK